MTDFKRYVVGFLFSSDGERVVLIRKNRPAWQKGKLNGVGGKVEEGETPFAAMIREFREETGVHMEGWDELATIAGETFRIWFYYAFGDAIDAVTTTTDESIEVWNVNDFYMTTLIPNLKVLIPLALDRTGLVKPVHFIDNFKEEEHGKNQTSSSS